MIRGITFDYWNTLMQFVPDEDDRQGAAMNDVLVSAGIELTPVELEAGRAAIRAWFETRWLANQPITPEEGGLELARALGFGRRDIAHRFGVIFRDGTDPLLHLRPAPGIEDVLADLRSRGIAIGIICDASLTPGATLRSFLDVYGLLGAFDHWVFSDEAGAFKPDGRLFAAAAVGLGIDDHRHLAHVGDLRRTDVAGAIEAGYVAVRYRGLHDDPDTAAPEAPHVIDDHRQLIGVLGL